MFNYSINWLKIIMDNLPEPLQRAWRIMWIQALIKPVKDVYSDFLATKTEYTYTVRINGQKCYLETVLNDTFPCFNQIYITDSFQSQNYIYQKSENKTPLYMYKDWNATYNYLAGQYAYKNGIVWVAAANNTNVNPTISSFTWAGTTLQPPFIRKASEYASAPSFIVWVPNTLVYDVNKMKALIEYYKLAGKTYAINGY